jgi:hypothetical protein
MALFLNILFGAIGSGYLVYAKRQYSARFAIFGVLLMVFPYFISSAIGTLLAGAALMAAPFVMERF